jgi:hypothetical protein
MDVRKYKRRVTPIESLFMRSPYSIVAMIARIKGEVTESMLRGAVGKVQLRHLILQARIFEDSDHTA